jgi:hypothetical protein
MEALSSLPRLDDLEFSCNPFESRTSMQALTRTVLPATYEDIEAFMFG